MRFLTECEELAVIFGFKYDAKLLAMKLWVKHIQTTSSINMYNFAANI